MAEKNRAHGKVDALPMPVRESVEEKLMNGQTYAAIAKDLNDDGYEVHESSVGRYGRRYMKRFESVRVAKQFARLLAEDNVERPPTELHEANNMIMNQLIMETIMDEDIDAKGLSGAAKSIASLQNAQINNERLKINARKEAGAVRVAMNLLKDKVFKEIADSHPEIANTLIELARQTQEELSKL